jgi:hypothetical protein
VKLFDNKEMNKQKGSSKKCPILVPKVYKVQKYFYGKLNVTVSETNEINTKEESYPFKL